MHKWAREWCRIMLPFNRSIDLKTTFWRELEETRAGPGLSREGRMRRQALPPGSWEKPPPFLINPGPWPQGLEFLFIYLFKPPRKLKPPEAWAAFQGLQACTCPAGWTSTNGKQEGIADINDCVVAVSPSAAGKSCSTTPRRQLTAGLMILSLLGR